MLLTGETMNFKNLFKSLLTYTPEYEYQFDLVSDASKQNNKIAKNDEYDNNNTESIYPSLTVNLEYMKTKYNTLINSDVILREFTLNARGKQYKAFLMYIDGMIDSEILNKFVLEPLMMRNKSNIYDGSQNKVISEAVTNNITVRKVKKFDLANYIMNCLIPQNAIKQVTDFEKVMSGINSRKLCFIYRHSKFSF